MIRAPDGTAFDLHRPQDAPVVVLIHGLGLNRALWQWTAPSLTRFRLLTHDFLGHGQTPSQGDRPVLGDLTAQLVRLLDYLRIDRAALVGFSMGGMLARHVAQVVAPLPPLTCPALVITGSEDHGNSPAMARAIAGDIARAQVAILPGLRHMALTEAPEVVNGPLQAFLAGTLRPH